MFEHDGRDSESFLSFGGRFDEDYCESRFEMLNKGRFCQFLSFRVDDAGMKSYPFDMTVEDPSTGIVRDKSNVHGSSGGNGHGISTNWVSGAFGVRRVESRIIGRDILSDPDNLKLVSMKMDFQNTSSVNISRLTIDRRAYKDEHWRPCESVQHQSTHSRTTKKATNQLMT